MALADGTRLGPYEIITAIGAGGMGEVYRARDTRLGRLVAVKVLPGGVAADEGRLRRFEQEARAASALNHPNILAIHDIGVHDGAPYLVMELLEGQTLTQRLGGRALPVAVALDYALQLGDGLAAAHAKGIVHRDVKPDNVFVTNDGRVKVLDFGLARQPEAPVGGAPEAATIAMAPRTEAGVILGTVGYMSPEQARGEPADIRSDVFSLGCVLYEMLGGQRPFARASAVETMHAIMMDEPRRLADVATSVPANLAAVVARCLEKRPGARFADAAEVVWALKGLQSTPSAVTAPAAGPDDKSLVVLPFADLSPGRDNEYFADGLTEEIIGDLSRIGSLRVTSRTTAMALKGTTKSLPALARELAVRYVLEGSVRRAGNALRISVQLVDSATDAHVWSEKFGGTLDDVFDIQENVSRAVTEALKVRLTASEDRRMAKRPIGNFQVYDIYLRARRAMSSFTVAGLREGEQLLHEGLQVAGENPLLLAGLARVHFEHVDLALEGGEGLADAEDFARRALALDPECAPASLVLGLVEHFRGDLALAVQHLRRALESDPNDTDTLWWLAWFSLWITGQHQVALEAARRQVELDPGNPMSHVSVALAQYVQGRFTEALAAIEGLPNEHPMFAYVRALALVGAGRRDEALAVLEPFEPQAEFDMSLAYALLIKFAISGRGDRFPEVLDPALVRLADLDACTAVALTMCYAAVGDADTALDWLEKAVPRGYFNYPYLRHHDPFVASLRGVPRFERTMDVMKVKWEAFRP